MNIADLIEEIEENLIKGNLEKCLMLLLDFSKNNNRQELREEVILLYSRFNSLNSRNNEGIEKNYQEELNLIRKTILVLSQNIRAKKDDNLNEIKVGDNFIIDYEGVKPLYIEKFLKEPNWFSSGNWFHGNLFDDEKKDAGNMSYENGQYVIWNKGVVSNLFSYKDVEIDEFSDYDLESVLYIKDSYSTCDAGIIWGSKDTENFNSFMITSSKRAKIISERANRNHIHLRRSEVIPTTKNKYLKYKLIISKRPGKIIFTVNDVVVFISEVINFMGNKIGFIVRGSGIAKFEYIQVF